MRKRTPLNIGNSNHVRVTRDGYSILMNGKVMHRVKEYESLCAFLRGWNAETEKLNSAIDAARAANVKFDYIAYLRS